MGTRQKAHREISSLAAGPRFVGPGIGNDGERGTHDAVNNVAGFPIRRNTYRLAPSPSDGRSPRESDIT